jgi:hypothetical protein
MKATSLMGWVVTGMLTAPAPVAGQAILTGRVVDTTGNPLRGVEVVIGASAPLATSGANGTFRAANVPSGEQTIVFRAVGYKPQELHRTFTAGDSIAVEVVMPVGVQVLPVLTTRAERRTASPRMAGYFERKERGLGTFIDDSLLRSREHSPVSDVLRRVSGLTLTYLPNGGGIAVQMSRAGTNSTCGVWGGGRCDRSASKGPRDSRCYAQVFLDGQRVYAPGTGDPGGFSIDQFKVVHLQAIEVYKGPAATPAQFNATGSACGTVLLWTRDR